MRRTRPKKTVPNDLLCWCGNRSLVFFNQEYRRCRECETLILGHPPTPESLRVTDDDHDFYGRKYYQEHLPREYGYPDLWERARGDLSERCLHWLRILLKYLLPPARILELGSAHGAFVALLRWAGFDASGLELSPSLVNQSREIFSIPVLLGPVEEQELEKKSLNAMVLMDVLEHLPDPKRTLESCLELLAPDGLLLLQTPAFRPDCSYEDLLERNDPFLKQLKPKEHLFLFSQPSLGKLLAQLGVAHQQIEPALFAHYDMSLVASRIPLRMNPESDINQALTAGSTGRLVQALLDLAHPKTVASSSEDLAARLAESEADRAARLEVIHRQGSRISCMETEVHLRLEENKKLWEKLVREEEEKKRLWAEWMDIRNGWPGMVESQQLPLERLGKILQDIAGTREKLENDFLQMQPLVQGLPALSREFDVIRLEKADLEAALEKTEKLLEQLRLDISLCQKENQASRVERQAQKELLQNQNQELVTLKRQNDQSIQRLEVAERTISEKDQQLRELDRRNGNLKENLLSLESERQALRDELDRLELLLNERQMAWSDLEFLHHQLSRSFREAQVSLEEKTAQMQQAISRGEMLEHELIQGEMEKSKQVQEINQACANLQAKYDTLQKRTSSLDNQCALMQDLLCRIGKTSTVRLLKRLGGWQWLKEDPFRK